MHRPLTFIPFLPLFLSFIFIQSNGEYETSANCTTSKCGEHEVKYPFWLRNDITSVQHCGYEGFGLNCLPSSTSPTGEQLNLPLHDDNFYVKDINYAAHRVTLVDIDAVKNNCPRPRHNLTLGDLPLEYSTHDLNLTFYFNCTPPLPSYINPIPLECLGSGGNMYVFSWERNQSEGTNDFGWFNVCEKKVVAPVLKEEFFNRVGEKFNWGNPAEWANTVVQALEEGFMLDWHTESYCGRCELSEGRCGSNSTADKFLCFCNDGRITNDICKSHGKRKNLGLKIGIGVASSVGSVIIMFLIFFLYQYRQKRKKSGSTLISREIPSYPSSVTDPEKGFSNYGVHIYDYSELEKATNNFDSKRELGDGGFGTVYKGKLQDGRDVAVKRLYESNFKRVEQFRNEVLILTRLHHQNLVSLYGCTSRHCRELLLVYEYIPNGTVADHLHGALARPGSLPWSTRMKIAIETASALSYLHASDVIHRDVKTNNILLDNHFCVKVADFGLSRLFPFDATHISTAPQGTPGYVDPEYHQCYHLTDRSDVFSFGVVLIELISSMPAVDITRHRHEINLSNLAINKIQSNSLHELVDPNLGFESDYNIRMMITDVAELAFQCLQYGRDVRPSMVEVLEALLQIQSKDYGAGNAKERDIQADDAQLLNARQQTSSPDSVIQWVSSSTSTSN